MKSFIFAAAALLVFVSGTAATAQNAVVAPVPSAEAVGVNPTQVAEMNEVTLRHWKEVIRGGGDGNIVWYPYVTSRSFLFLGRGASGKALEELAAAVPYATKTENRTGYADILRRAGNDKLSVTTVSSFWVQPKFRLYESFPKLATRDFDISIFSIQGEHPATAGNAWASEMTGGKIKEVFTDEMLLQASAALVTATKIKGDWERAFDPADIRENRDFFPDGADPVKVKMLSKTDIPVAGVDNGVAMALEVKGGATVLLILPSEGKSVKDLNFTSESLVGLVSKLRLKEAETMGIELPKFDVSGRIDLVQAGKGVGLKRMFEASPDPKDYSFLRMTPDDVYVSHWFQQGNLRLDEYGFSGEAVEVVTFRSRGIGPQFVTFDRPFLMAVINEDGLVLNLARISNPATK